MGDVVKDETENQEIAIFDGAKVFDEHGDAWVHTGVRLTTAGTYEHWFVKLGMYTGQPLTYKATFRSTIVKKFPNSLDVTL